MKFRTEYQALKSSIILDPSNPMVMMGSCFSQNMASKMLSCQWEAMNPAGTLYNPLSISEVIDMLMDDEGGVQRFEESLFHYNGLWNSHMFDSSFSSSEKEDCIEQFRQSSRQFQEGLTTGKTLIVTFGTSICYFLEDKKIAVGNCHKQPAQLFYRKRLTIAEIKEIWIRLIQRLRKKIPELKIIFTVSPVRHLKDGFIGNARSKSILQLAIEEICGHEKACEYFPAYEILNDDLRDYRFYATDLVHPSDEGVEYIWEKFTETYLDEEGLRKIKEGSNKYKSEHHRPKIGALDKPLRNPY